MQVQRRTAWGPAALLLTSIAAGALFVALGAFQGGEAAPRSLLATQLEDDVDSIDTDGGIDDYEASKGGITDDPISGLGSTGLVSGGARKQALGAGAPTAVAVKGLPSMKQDYAAERKEMQQRMLAQYESSVHPTP